MDRRAVLRASRAIITALSLLAALALVLGIQPRTLAQEVGIAPLDSAACFLCDGSATAATIAPASGSILPAFVAPLALVALVLTPVVVAPRRALGRGAAPPLLPPPRS